MYREEYKLDYRKNGDTLDDFAQKYMNEIDRIYTIINAIKTNTCDDIDPGQIMVKNNIFYVRNALNTEWVEIGTIAKAFGIDLEGESWKAQFEIIKQNAATSASNAKTSETNAKTSEANAKTSETNAANSASEASQTVETGKKDISDLVSSGTISLTELINNGNASLIETINDGTTSLTSTTTSGVTSVTAARDNAVTTVNNTRDSAVNTVNTTKDSAVSAVNTAKVDAISAISSSVQAAANSASAAKTSETNAGKSAETAGDYEKKAKTYYTSTYHTKGDVEYYADLPTNPENGDVYRILNADSERGVRAGDKLAWIESSSSWDNFAGNIDLSGYVSVPNVASKGSATQGVYFDKDGVAQPMSHTLEKSVPSDADFTNTWRGIQNNLESDLTDESLSAAQGKLLKKLLGAKVSIAEESSITFSLGYDENGAFMVTPD